MESGSLSSVCVLSSERQGDPAAHWHGLSRDYANISALFAYIKEGEDKGGMEKDGIGGL